MEANEPLEVDLQHWWYGMGGLSCQDNEIRKRIQDAEKTLALTMPETEARERLTQLKAEAEVLERLVLHNDQGASTI